MAEMTVGKAIAKFLEKAGVEYVFGFNGHGNWMLLDSIEHETKIQGIICRREDQAVHMADGYWRMKRQGPPPIAVTTVGPGNMNIPPALANAFYDSSAMVVLAGAGPTQWYGKGGLEESYRYRPEGWTDVVRPISKAAWDVNRPETAVEHLARAMKLAVSGRPGPVVLQVPFDVQHEPIDVKDMDPKMFTDNINSKPRPNSEAIQKAADIIKKANKPLIIAGGGVKLSGAFEELKDLAETYNIPVATSLMGKGSLSESHPLSLGVAGMCGTHTAYMAAGACDVVIGIGCRFNDCHTAQWRMYKIPDQAKLIHIDIDVEEIGRNYPTEVGIVADSKMALIDLKDALVGMKPLDQNGEWWIQINQWRKEHHAKISDAINSDWVPVHYATLFNIVTKVVNEIDPEASVLFDTGNSQSFAPTFFGSQSPNISSNGQFAQMGFTVPAIIGAKLARPNNAALAICGDGSFLMTTQAVATAAQYDIPVVWVVFNNQSLLMERELMLGAYGRESFCDYYKDELDLNIEGKKSKGKGKHWNPDLIQLANGLGAEAYRIMKPEEIESAVRKALTTDKPVVLDVWVNQNTPGWYNIPFYFPSLFKDRGMETPYLPPHNNIYK